MADPTTGCADNEPARALAWERAVLAALSRLYRPLISPRSSFADIADAVLAEARALTESRHGFVSTIDPETGDNVGHTLTAMREDACRMPDGERKTVFRRGPDGRYPGLGGHALNTRRGFFTNDPARHPEANGAPEGHARLERFLSVPVLLADHLVGQISLANPPSDYTDRDLLAVERLAELYALAILRVRTEDSLRDERNFISAVLSTADALVVVLDRDGRIVRFNRTCERLTGYRSEEVLGQPLWDALLTPEEDRDVKAVFSRLRSGDFPVGHENFWKTKDGGRRRVSWSNTCIVDELGDVEFIIGTGIDVTVLREAEAELRRLNDSLEHKVAERTAVAEQRAAQLQTLARDLTGAEQRERRRLAQVLHDHLQQLIVGARLRLGALRGGGPGGDPDGDDGVEGNRAALAEIDALLGQAIEASRSLTIDLSPPILHQSGLEEALRWLGGTMADRHGLDVEVLAEQGASDADETLSVLIFEAVRELLFNVAKHSGVRRARVIMGREPDGRLRVTVEDEGAGFDAGEARPPGRPGGFGLFSIRERVGFLGGEVRILTAPGDGTRVHIVVPASSGTGGGRQTAPADGSDPG